MSNLETASVLAFERKLDMSDGVFWQLNSQTDTAPRPIDVREKSVRGTISNRLKNVIANDPVKLDAETEKANLQTVDVAALDADNDTLLVKWSCKVLPFTGRPNVCNNQAYQAKLLEIVNTYITNHGVTEVSKRYAANIANARWLWRNRLGAQSIQVTGKCQFNGAETVIVFNDAIERSLQSFNQSDEKLSQLQQLIEAGLNGSAFIILNIEAKAIVGLGQEVYPSQELILDTGKKKSKVLYQINQQAGMHSQKIGNAIRTIDTWYGDNVQFPIAIEPYGAVTTLGTAFRKPKPDKNDFYTLFDNWILKDQVPSVEQQHYIIAVLIRGGVFGASGKE